MELVAVDTKDPTPIYAQLDRGLRAAIATGAATCVGDQLLTVGQLAVELRDQRQHRGPVYAELERAGDSGDARRGVGSFVAASGNQARPADEHPRRLTAFATRVLADGGGAGFGAEEVITGA